MRLHQPTVADIRPADSPELRLCPPAIAGLSVYWRRNLRIQKRYLPLPALAGAALLATACGGSSPAASPPASATPHSSSSSHAATAPPKSVFSRYIHGLVIVSQPAIGTVNVDGVRPIKAGGITDERSFGSPSNATEAYSVGADETGADLASQFNTNDSEVIADGADGSAGYVDVDSNYHPVTGPESGYGQTGVPKQAIGFGTNGLFWYQTATGSSSINDMVGHVNLSQGAKSDTLVTKPVPGEIAGYSVNPYIAPNGLPVDGLNADGYLYMPPNSAEVQNGADPDTFQEAPFGQLTTDSPDLTTSPLFEGADFLRAVNSHEFLGLANGTGETQLYLFDIKAGVVTSRPLLPSGSDLSVTDAAVSPDGTQVAFIATTAQGGTSTLYITPINADGAQPMQVGTTFQGTWMLLGWHP